MRVRPGSLATAIGVVSRRRLDRRARTRDYAGRVLLLQDGAGRSTLGSPEPMHPHIAVDAAGRIMVAWEELLDRGRVAAARKLTPGGAKGLAAGPVVRLSGPEPGSYPVLASAGDAFVAV